MNAQRIGDERVVIEEPSAWAIGWTAFAGIMMVMMGGWWIISGLIGIVNDQFFVTTADYVFKFDTTTWGWVHLLLGVVIMLAGFGLFTGAIWARTVGVVIAVLAGLVAFAWLPWYPVWAAILIAISAAVIWALTAHGRDITQYDTEY